MIIEHHFFNNDFDNPIYIYMGIFVKTKAKTS